MTLKKIIFDKKNIHNSKKIIILLSKNFEIGYSKFSIYKSIYYKMIF